MSTLKNSDQIKAAIADAVVANSTTPAITVESLAAQLESLAKRNAMLEEMVQLQKNLSAAKPAAPATPQQTAPVSTTPAAEVKPRADYDALLLKTIAKFKGSPRTDGKPSGALAVKVHAYLHACGWPELDEANKTGLRSYVESATKRNVISRMSVPTKNGSRMMLYFDAKERARGRG